jgi:hypothetical protein
MYSTFAAAPKPERTLEKDLLYSWSKKGFSGESGETGRGSVEFRRLTEGGFSSSFLHSIDADAPEESGSTFTNWAR